MTPHNIVGPSLKHICKTLAADTNPNPTPSVFRRTVDGEVLTLGEIFEQMPPWVKYNTLALRLDRAGPFTWQELSRKPKSKGGTSEKAKAVFAAKRARQRYARQQQIERSAKFDSLRSGHKSL